MYKVGVFSEAVKTMNRNSNINDIEKQWDAVIGADGSVGND